MLSICSRGSVLSVGSVGSFASGGNERWLSVVAVVVGGLPIGWFVGRRLVRRAVARGLPPSVARRDALAEVGMVGGTFPWLCVVLTPLPAAGAVRLLPVVDLAQVLNGHPLTGFFQIVGNLLVFAAFGLLAPVRWRGGPVAVTAGVAAASTTVETLQHVLALGRVSSIDDVLLNTAGAGLAVLLGRHLRRRSDRDPLSRQQAAEAPFHRIFHTKSYETHSGKSRCCPVRENAHVEP